MLRVSYYRLIVTVGLVLGLGTHLLAQVLPAPAVPPMREVTLDSIQVRPGAVDYSGWLLLDKDIQLELAGAVDNLYNFKFDRADKQFRSLRRRYPQHPMPYFLLALSTWWKSVPLNPSDTRYDPTLLAYLDTTQTKAAALYKADDHNYEACFFLSGAYGMEARRHAERHQLRRVVSPARQALIYLEKSHEANGLSSEFLFGEALFNYYAVWIGEEYPLLKPVLFFFPKGNRAKGLAQLRQVGQTAFYTGTEANFFLINILNSEREQQPDAALALARRLALRYPDNPRFQLDYARLCFQLGQFDESEKTSLAMLRKYAVGQVGYEAYTCRAAAYIMGYLMQKKYHNDAQARDYYQRCMVYSEQSGMARRTYYVFAEAGLARLADQQHDEPTARRFYQAVVDDGDKAQQAYQEARTWLRTHRQ